MNEISFEAAFIKGPKCFGRHLAALAKRDGAGVTSRIGRGKTYYTIAEGEEE
jgi:hypothetical protein